MRYAKDLQIESRVVCFPVMFCLPEKERKGLGGGSLFGSIRLESFGQRLRR